MKIKIRTSVFETNSSSMHSLVVKKENEYYTQEEMTERMYLDDNGVWKIWSDDLYYGRELFQCLGDFSKKVEYAIASLCGYNDNARETFDDNTLKIDFNDTCEIEFLIQTLQNFLSTCKGQCVYRKETWKDNNRYK